VDYHFVDNATFDRMVRDDQLLEYAEFAGNRYGTPREPVERALTQGSPAVLEIELQGARQVRMAMPHARLVMLVPPSWGDLVGRLTNRGTEQRDAVYARLTEAAAHGDSDATTIVTEGATCIARAVAGLIAPLGVRRVMVSGTSVAMAPRLYLEAMTAVLPDETRLRVSTVQPHPGAVGAAAPPLAPQD